MFINYWLISVPGSPHTKKKWVNRSMGEMGFFIQYSSLTMRTFERNWHDPWKRNVHEKWNEYISIAFGIIQSFPFFFSSENLFIPSSGVKKWGMFPINESSVHYRFGTDNFDATKYSNTSKWLKYSRFFWSHVLNGELLIHFPAQIGHT